MAWGERSGSDVVLRTIATEGPTPDETQPSDESICIHAYQSETLLMLGDFNRRIGSFVNVR
jgi:hypothetical protein